MDITETFGSGQAIGKGLIVHNKVTDEYPGCGRWYLSEDNAGAGKAEDLNGLISICIAWRFRDRHICCILQCLH